MIDFGLAQELVPGVRLKALKGTPEFMGKSLSYLYLILDGNERHDCLESVFFLNIFLPGLSLSSL